MAQAAWRGILFQQIAVDILEFPLWWYTRGLVLFGRTFFWPLVYYNQFFALPVLAVNLTQPLFGDYTRSGRILSVCVRIGHFLVLGTAFVMVSAALVVAYLFWVFLPLIAVAEFIRTLVSLLIPG